MIEQLTTIIMQVTIKTQPHLIFFQTSVTGYVIVATERQGKQLFWADKHFIYQYTRAIPFEQVSIIPACDTEHPDIVSSSKLKNEDFPITLTHILLCSGGPKVGRNAYRRRQHLAFIVDQEDYALCHMAPKGKNEGRFSVSMEDVRKLYDGVEMTLLNDRKEPCIFRLHDFQDGFTE